jgi:hypothetical protein
MNNENQDEAITNAINSITGKISYVLLQNFLILPNELQLNVVLLKSVQLLLVNILCQVATTNDELTDIGNVQGSEIKELTINCTYAGFADKFSINKH